MHRNGFVKPPVVITGAAIPREKPPRSAPKRERDWLERWGKRIPWLVVCFWTLVLTLVVISHVMRTSATTTTTTAAATTTHGYQRFALITKLNALLSGLSYDALLSYRVCCNMAGGHMECPSERDAECHVMRDEGPRLVCYWVAPRLEGASCVLYWVAVASSAVK